jgi:hypothetical protein
MASQAEIAALAALGLAVCDGVDAEYAEAASQLWRELPPRKGRRHHPMQQDYGRGLRFPDIIYAEYAIRNWNSSNHRAETSCG